MINVVIITPGFPINENDSTCVPFIQLFIKELIKNKAIHLTIITEQYPKGENYLWHHSNVITLQKNEPLLYYKLMRYVRLKRALKKINGQGKIDVVHNFWFTKSALIASQFSFKNQIKHLVTFSGQEVLATNKLLSELTAYKGLLFCLSEFHREQLKTSARVSAHIVEPGIEKIEPKKIEKDIDLIFCGHISKLKNYQRFVDIVAAVNKTTPLKKVVMCGGGDGLALLKSKIQLLGLQNLIDIKGEIPRLEVIELMHRSKMLVHTSEFESFGLVLVEALACNCQVISTPVGIAWKHPKINTCITDAEFISKVEFCLTRENEVETNAAKYLASDMANRYLEIYKS